MTDDTQAQGVKHEPVRKALEMLHNTLAVATKPKHHDEATARFRARLTPYDIAHLLNEHDRLAAALQGRAQEGEPSEWQPIETAPVGREMFVVRAFHVRPQLGGWPYTSDPYCTWQEEPGFFARWPHRNFQPTHWMPLPAAPRVEIREAM